MAFAPVKQTRIAVEIVNQLKTAILSDQFRSGDRLPTERELTEQFKVSRVVVREAIRELEIKGWVKILQGPTGGAYVTDLSFDHLNNAFLDLFLYNKLSVVELIRARILIECEIARLATANITPHSTDRLKRALEAESIEPRSHSDFVLNRLMIHYILAELSGNRLLQAIATSLFRLTGEVVLEVKPQKKVIHRPEEHVPIVDAILSKDAGAAAAAMQHHLEKTGERLMALEGVYRKSKQLGPSERKRK